MKKLSLNPIFELTIYVFCSIFLFGIGGLWDRKGAHIDAILIWIIAAGFMIIGHIAYLQRIIEDKFQKLEKKMEDLLSRNNLNK